ncbi:MAG: phosphonoacetaldehyde reductase, partial [Azoarcus sp.]|nr:phosphonoacetaldehyde reductase [Azoarcus sp.]
MTFFMDHEWQFQHPVKIHCGRGCRRELANTLKKQNVLLVTSKRGLEVFRTDPWLKEIADHNTFTPIHPGSSLDRLQEDIDTLRNQAANTFDLVLALGGGSIIDAAKVIDVALSEACRNHALRDLLLLPELYRTAQTRPLYVLPTTAGTGSEATPFAVLWDRGEKLSMSGPALFPHAAYVDSALMDTQPRAVTLSGGLDAINQAAESIWNKNATPLTFACAARALELGFDALPQLLGRTKTHAETARDKMAEASLLAGFAISHTRTALCHALSYPLTGYFGIPHGLACAFTMPAVLRYNLASEDGRFSQLARILTGEANPEALLQCFTRLHRSFHVSRLVKRK